MRTALTNGLLAFGLLVSGLIPFSLLGAGQNGWLVGAAVILAFTLGLMSDVLAWIVLGVALCSMPALGPGVLSIFISALCFGQLLGLIFERNQVESPIRLRVLWFLFFATLLVPIAASFTATLLIDYDRLVVQSLLSLGGIRGLVEYLSQSYVTWHRALIYTAGILEVAVAFFILAPLDDSKRKFYWLSLGLMIGAFLAAILTILQLQGVPFPFNYSPFWVFVNRLPGGFSDPNSCGLMVLIIGIVTACNLRVRPILSILTFASLGVLGLYSGSRTLVLGVIVAVATLLISLIVKARQRSAKLFGIIVAAMSVMILALLGQPGLNKQLQVVLPVPTVQRVLQTLNWESGGEMLSSRTIYTKTAIAVIKTSPIYGVGLGRFYALQPDIQQKLGIDLKGWRDNANSFYLQILAEQGVLGFSLHIAAGLILLLLFLTRRDQDNPAVFRQGSAILSVVMLAVLFTGPHFDFEEVRFSFVILLGLGLGEKLDVAKIHVRLVALAVLVLGLLFPLLHAGGLSRTLAPRSVSGFYEKEQIDGRLIAWSAEKAVLHLCRDSAEPVVVLARALHPDLKDYPVSVEVYQVGNREQTAQFYSFSDPQWKRLEIPYGGQRLSIVFEVSRLWSPAASGTGRDPRWLGIMLEWPKEICSDVVPRR